VVPVATPPTPTPPLGQPSVVVGWEQYFDILWDTHNAQGCHFQARTTWSNVKSRFSIPYQAVEAFCGLCFVCAFAATSRSSR
jgi:hypothetical protein